MPPSAYRTIYILCPARVRTGGPEALHQLGRALRDLGHDAQMVYLTDPRQIGTREGDSVTFPGVADPTPQAYGEYAVPYTFQVADTVENAVVVPETLPGVAQSFRHVKRHLWWLSVDIGLKPVAAVGGLDTLRDDSWVHMCQSHYALAYLAQRGIIGLPLFDYTSPTHIAAASKNDAANQRQDRILYPARSAWFAGWLKRWAPDLAWQEIVGLTSDQAQRLFLTSKLYIDFGRHPGKDRMPREAAILGCCIITGRQGSAANLFDVPILSNYKYRDSRMNVPQIVRGIRTVLAEYACRLPDFAIYRQIIAGEREEFISQVKRAFGWQDG